MLRVVPVQGVHADSEKLQSSGTKPVRGDVMLYAGFDIGINIAQGVVDGEPLVT